ncbi:MAG TPA: LCP family protein [Candidatus Dojkabacteria bacterium]|nr:LCP family protein [Candidatus Dojkabacteria bacterium]
MEVSINLTDKEINNGKPLKERSVQTHTKKKRPFLTILFIFLVLVIGSGLYFGYKGYMTGKGIGLNLSPSDLIGKQKEPELKKDSTGAYTNILIVGIDTRTKLKTFNTDVIIVASYNHKTKDVVMISIPRDFCTKVNPSKTSYGKINSAYSIYEAKEKGSGLEGLKGIVEEITGMEIQYYTMINFNGFVELVDAVGGLYINVENSFTDYKYPAETGYGTQTISFKAGPQLMDGDTALKYARSRQSQQNGEGSDYARAKRQHKVIDAFIKKLLSTETLLNPNKVMSLLTSIQDNIKVSEFTIDDIQAGVNVLKSLSSESSTSSTYSFVLDPTIGNYSLISHQPSCGEYNIGPKEGLGRYTKLGEYINLALSYPALYSENPSIYSYDTGLGYQNTKTKTEELKTRFKYLDIRFQGTKFNDKEGTYIYSNTTDKFSKSVDILASYLKTNNKVKPEYLTTATGGDISILFGKEIIQDETVEIQQSE